MRFKRLLGQALGLERAVIEGWDFDPAEQALVVSVRVKVRDRNRCGRCGRRCPGYDRGRGRRRWRALDMGTCRVFVEAHAYRVNCVEHGPTVSAVPWARHGSGHTRDFDDLAAWLAVHVSKSAVTSVLRVAWRTVGAIVARVSADIDARVDRLEGLKRIGIDEISYKRHHRYLTVVVDHDTGRLVWAQPGRDDATLGRFFDALGPERCGRISHVSSDLAPWIARVLAAKVPQAVHCADPFHVVAWATEAMDVERRRAWNEASGRVKGDPASRAQPTRAKGASRQFKKVRYALWKNPENLTAYQTHQLEWVAKTDPRLYRAYLLKEALRYAMRRKGEEGKDALEAWIAWARRSQLKAFVELAAKVEDHQNAIDAALDSGLSNGLIESTNTKIRLLTRIAFGFHGPQPLIALALLALGGHCPDLPGRNRPTH